MRKFLFIFAATTMLLCCGVPLSQGGLRQSASQPFSPRLASLQKELAAGNREALDRFWQQVTHDGTPIVEPIEGDAQNVMLTFLWRAKEETRNVLVLSGPARGDMSRDQMSRLSDSDVWYKTYRVPRDARFTYQLSPNDSLVPFDEVDPKDMSKRVATVRIDPLNRGGLGGGSGIELPGAPPQPWNARQPDIPKGKLEAIKIKSSILNNERRAWVYTPPGYTRDGGPYGLIVMFDGPMYTLLIPTPTILDNLLSKSKTAPTVALILDNPTPTSRETEFACFEPFAEFIAKEVIPWVRANYNVADDPRKNVVSGVSFGGLAATFVGLRHPEIFGNVISQSGSFWWKPSGDVEHEWLTRQFVSKQKLPLRFHLDVGLFERGPTPEDGPDMVTVNRHMRDVLKAKGYDVDYHECNCGHDALNWRGQLPDALMFLLEGARR
jgi:enterochelin esterase-like enzyme